MKPLFPRRWILALACLVTCVAAPAIAQQKEPGVEEQVQSIKATQENLEHTLDQLAKAVDDVSFQLRLGDVAEVDKWRITGPPPAHVENPKETGATNPVRFYTYTFVPKPR